MTQKTNAPVETKEDVSSQTTIDDTSDLDDTEDDMGESDEGQGSDDNIFDDDDLTEEPSKTATAKQDEKTKVKYNGADVELTKEELITNAQKGMNYDKILQERDQARNSEELKTLSDLAKEAGKDVKTFLGEMKQTIEGVKLSKRIEELTAEGFNPEQAKRFAEMESKAKMAETIPAEVKEQEENVNSFKELFSEFPETSTWKTLEDFPKEVSDMIQQGKNPVIAYTKYLAGKAEADLATVRQAKDNKARDLGSLKSGKSDEKTDDFLEGLGF